MQFYDGALRSFRRYALYDVLCYVVAGDNTGSVQIVPCAPALFFRLFLSFIEFIFL